MRDLRRIPLPFEGWRLQATGGAGASRLEGPIAVPPHAGHASVFPALEHAGIARAEAGERAELDGEWVGRTDWCFSAEIDVPGAEAGRHCALAIEWIDGPCDVVLSGMDSGPVALGAHMSEHVPFDARIPDALRGTRALLELRFRAPVDEVLRWQERLGARPVNGDWTPFCFARSAACSFGWDWGPRVPAVGFQGARLDCWSETRITGVSVAQRWNDEGSVTIRVTPQGEFDASRLVCVVRARANPRHFPCDACGEVTLPAEEVAHRWTTWDRRDAQHDLCWWNAMVGFRDAAGAFKPIATQRFAPRRIELDAAPDDAGRRFRFVLNGEPLFARGANLIPPSFGRSALWDWRDELTRLRDTGFNMVRVWGGGIYLPGAFHEMCDELGILVWQDFMFACATYPEDEPFATLVAREAAHQVQRLSCHPSLALWCGGNEDILAWWSWGWKERLAPGQSWGLRYWLETLPAAVAAHDPGTPYWAESPYSGSMDIHPNDPDHGDRHTWDAEAKIEGYRTILPRFSSEFGHQSPPCWTTITEHCLEASRDPARMTAAELVDALRLRQKAWGGDDFQYRPFLEARFREARVAREYVAQAQHLQARAMSVAMRWLRAGAPRSMGALIWQWNDVWAGHSWSLVDIESRVKPSWHAVRRACAPRMLSIEPTGGFTHGTPGALEVVLSDDGAFRDPAGFARARATVTLERMDFAGSVAARVRIPLEPHAECGLPAATLRGRIPAEFIEGTRRAHELLVATVDGEPELGRAVEFLGDDAELALPEPMLEPVVAASGSSIGSTGPGSPRVASDARRDGAGSGTMRATCVVREFWIEQTWPRMRPHGSQPRPSDQVDPAHLALEHAARSANWRTLLPGDEVTLPPGAVWWSANHFAKIRG